VSVTPLPGWILAADADVLELDGPEGRHRTFAAGTEARINRRTYLRGGVNLNTAGDRDPGLTTGLSVAATASLLVDAYVTRGSDKANRGWGIAARFGY
jgi:hypothetical protein